MPRPDWPKLFRSTNEIIGGGDPEFQSGKDSMETFAQARMEVFQYFTDLVEQRRKHPTGDVTSIIANAEIDGAPIPALELLSYLLVLVVAGNETTAMRPVAACSRCSKTPNNSVGSSPIPH